eukprot:TRINITY_DN122_c1_g1_i9.p1 TRINITY_DN122_c1_g1~~TRINITY_DN122_c1_g1_i9.p1  ORF type:complete len:386 (-),score=54.06 TRINITY_DN122_c1_g1_i9:286-1380(-)
MFKGKNSFSLRCVAFALLGMLSLSAAFDVDSCLGSGYLELITNGGFDTPQLDRNWKNFGSEIDGWFSSKGNGIELWRQSYSGSPAKDYFGQPTGQHMELSGNSKNGYISAEFVAHTCGYESAEATLSFQFWQRTNWRVDSFGFSLVKDDEIVLSGDLSADLTTDEWVYYTNKVTLENNARYILTFYETSPSTGGTHIDSVSLTVPKSGLPLLKPLTDGEGVCGAGSVSGNLYVSTARQCLKYIGTYPNHDIELVECLDDEQPGDVFQFCTDGTIRNEAGDMCFTEEYRDATHGWVMMRPCVSSDAQVWKMGTAAYKDGVLGYELVNLDSGLCLELGGNGQGAIDWGKIETFSCRQLDDQFFVFN